MNSTLNQARLIISPPTDQTLGINNTSLQENENEGTVVATHYYSINRTEMQKPNNAGLYIAKKYDNDSTKTSKFIVK